jgi:hypothetical protein
VADRTRAQTAQGQRFLCSSGRGDDYWGRIEFYRYQSYQGAFLERCDQRRGGSTDHDRMMLMTTNKEITGGVQLPNLQKTVGWIATGVMFGVAACLMVRLL